MGQGSGSPLTATATCGLPTSASPLSIADFNRRTTACRSSPQPVNLSLRRRQADRREVSPRAASAGHRASLPTVRTTSGWPTAGTAPQLGTRAGNPDAHLAIDLDIDKPFDIAFNRRGQAFVTGNGSNAVEMLNPDGTPRTAGPDHWRRDQQASGDRPGHRGKHVGGELRLRGRSLPAGNPATARTHRVDHADLEQRHVAAAKGIHGRRPERSLGRRGGW
jgi:hypothetical protein